MHKYREMRTEMHVCRKADEYKAMPKVSQKNIKKTLNVQDEKILLSETQIQ